MRAILASKLKQIARLALSKGAIMARGYQEKRVKRMQYQEIHT